MHPEPYLNPKPKHFFDHLCHSLVQGLGLALRVRPSLLVFSSGFRLCFKGLDHRYKSSVQGSGLGLWV